MLEASMDRKEEELKSLAEDRRRNHRRRAGYIVRPRIPSEWKSPSTASTSSLAQLRVKLEQMPYYKYNKQAVSVCAEPALSFIAETSVEDAQSTTYSFTSSNAKRCGVIHRGTTKNTKSDKKCLSPVLNDECTSFLLSATLGTTDQSIINNAVENFTKTKSSSSDNIVDSLIKEALRSKIEKEKVTDCSRGTDKNCTKNLYENSINNSKGINSEVIENTQVEELYYELPVKNTSDKSKSSLLSLKNDKLKHVIETSSESRDNFIKNQCQAKAILFEVNEIDIIECLDSIVDTICSDFDKCKEYLDTSKREHKTKDDKKRHEKSTLPQSSIDHFRKEPQSKTHKKTIHKSATVKVNVKDNIDQMTKAKLSGPTRLEKERKTSLTHYGIIKNPVDVKNKTTRKKSSDVTSLTLRKKRKLYSLKDDQNNMEEAVPEKEDDAILFEIKNLESPSSLNVTPNANLNIYKDIVGERHKNSQKPAKFNNIFTSYAKNNNDEIFNKLKSDSSNDQLVKLINPRLSKTKMAVHNFNTSGSDDDDFIESPIKKRLNSTRVTTVKAPTSQQGRVLSSIAYFENKSNTFTNRHEPKKITKTKRNVVNVSNSNRININLNRISMMRKLKKPRKAGPNILNTSLIVEKSSVNLSNSNIEPTISGTSDIQGYGAEINCKNVKQHVSIKSNKTDTKKNVKTEETTLSGKRKKIKQDTHPKTAFSPLLVSVPSAKSPLLGLVNKKVQTNKKMKKWKEICKGCSFPDDLNTSQTAFDLIRNEENPLECTKHRSMISPIRFLCDTIKLSQNIPKSSDSEKSKRSLVEINKLNTKRKKVNGEKEIDKFKSDSSNDQLIINYNTSESDNKGFKESTIKKCLSSTRVTTVKAPTSQRGRVLSRIDYFENKNNTFTNRHEPRKITKKKRTVVNRSSFKSMNVNVNRSSVTKNLEKMRNAGPDILNTFLIVEKSSVNLSNSNKEPTISGTSDIQGYGDEINCRNKKDRKKNVRTNKTTSSRKRKKITQDTHPETEVKPSLVFENRTDDSLHGLEIKKVQTGSKDINNSLNMNTMQKRKEICKGRSLPEDLNTSQIAFDLMRNEKNLLKDTKRRSVISPIRFLCDAIKLSQNMPKSSDSEESKKSSVEINKLNTKTKKDDREKEFDKWIDSQEVMSDTVEGIKIEAKEIIKNVIEKVDTTLTNSNQTARQRLMELNSHYEKYFQEMNKKLHELLKIKYRETLMEACKLIDAKFSLLHRASEELRDAVKKKIELGIMEIVKKDAEQRQAVVVILREEIKLALDHIKNLIEK